MENQWDRIFFAMTTLYSQINSCFLPAFKYIRVLHKYIDVINITGVTSIKTVIFKNDLSLFPPKILQRKHRACA